MYITLDYLQHLMRQASCDHEYFEINEPKKSQNFNYMIPPAPKPVYKYNQMKQNNPQQFNTIDVINIYFFKCIYI